MSVTCACNDLTLGNMGTPNCNEVAKVTKRLIIMPAFKADGTRNGITLATTLNAAYFADKVNQYKADATRNPLAERWYPSPLLEAVADVRDDTIYQEFPSGKKSKTREGVRHFEGFIVQDAAFELLGKIKRDGCTELAAFLIDSDGSIIGVGNVPGGLSTALYGIRIDKDSFDSMLVKSTDDSVQQIKIMFDWHRLEKDEDLKKIKASDLVSTDMLSIAGSYDVYGTLGAASTTTLAISLYTSYGSAKSPIVVTGLVAADVKLFNRTDSLAVTVVSLVESSTVPGDYVVTFAAQTSTDTMQWLIKKAGLDGTAVEALIPAIP